MYDQQNASDPEEFLTCPYDKGHQVTRKRMQKHLIDCRRNFRELARDMVTCPFHVTHQHPRTEIEVHKLICPHRDTFYSYAYSVVETSEPVQEAVNNTFKALFVPGDESWDIDEEEPSGSVHQELEKMKDECTNIYRNYQNMPPAERKARREEVRLKEQARMNEEEHAARSDLRNRTSSTSKDTRSISSSSVVGPQNRASSPTDGACSIASPSVVSAPIRDIPQSSAMSDSSFNTALDVAASRLEEFQLVTKKGRGKGRATPPEKPNSLAGVGRGRRLNN